MNERNASASTVVSTLINGSRTDRDGVLQTLAKCDDPSHIDAVVQELVKALNLQFYVRTDDAEADKPIASVRSWILTTIARFSRNSADTAIAKKHLDHDFEPDRWCRYWTLAGFIRGDKADLETIAQKSSETDPDVLVKQLAFAALAKLGHSKARDTILAGLKDSDLRWSTLRALRVVPISGTTRALAEIVRQGEWTDDTYDAIIALGEVPTGPFFQEETEAAARSLVHLVGERRRYPMWDSMRMNALQSLGRLGATASTSTLVEELTDDNPGVVREAARALESILGTRRATDRVIEACEAAPDQVSDYAIALRWLDRDKVAEELDIIAGSGAGATQELARTLLSEIGGNAAFQKLRSRRQAMEQYAQAREDAERTVRELFETSIKGARTGFTVAIAMDVCVFIVGMLLISVSGYLALGNNDALQKWAGVGVTGGVGVLSVLYEMLVAKPREKIRGSVDYLMQLQIVFLGYLRQLHQVDQAYTRRLLDDEAVAAPELQSFTGAVADSMSEALGKLGGPATRSGGDIKPKALVAK